MAGLLYTVGLLPSSGKLSAADINEELRLPLGQIRSLNDPVARNLAGKPTKMSRIKYSDFHSKLERITFKDVQTSVYLVLDQMYHTHYCYVYMTPSANGYQRYMTVVPYGWNVGALNWLTPNPITVTTETNSQGLKAEVFFLQINYRRGCEEGNDQNRQTDYRIRAISTAPYYEVVNLGNIHINGWGC